MSDQLFFNFNHKNTVDKKEIILATYNNHLFNFLFTSPNSWSDNTIVIIGDTFIGKTTIINAYLNEVSGIFLKAQNINAFLKHQIIKTAIAIDDIHLVPNKYHASIFDLFSFAKLHNIKLILISNKAIEFAIPDLNSRVKSSLIFSLPQPEPDVLIKIIIKSAFNNGTIITEEVAKYIIESFSKDTNQIKELLSHIYYNSMQNNRKITIPFVKSIIDKSPLKYS